MKVFAVVPALLVLISLCGSPVPPPPGSVSGTVYYDANHNAIHDSCDGPLSLVNVQATGSDGKTETATADADGNFRIDKVPSGATTVTLQVSSTEVWPITTAPSAVLVKGPKQASGIEIGSASRQPLPSQLYTVIGVIYNDANGNGQIDRDECGIPNASAYINALADSGRGSDTPPSSDGSYAITGLSTLGPVVVSGLFERTWLPTTTDAGDPCDGGVMPKRLANANLYAANIGFKQGSSQGELKGVLFDDSNGNGVRDAGESGVSNARVGVEPVSHACGNVDIVWTTTNFDGSYGISHLPPGIYDPIFGTQRPTPDQFVEAAWPTNMTLTIGDSAVTADLPAAIVPAGDVTVALFSDTNGDGVREDGERAMPGVNVCLENSATDGQANGNRAPAYPQAHAGDPTISPCATSDGAGDSVLGPVPAGDYGILVNGGSEPESPPPPVHLAGPSGVSVQIAMPPFQSRVIQPGAGTSLPLHVCYSDDSWVQRPFEEGYDSSASFYAAWNVNESLARTMYAEGIYEVSARSPDSYVWSAIAGLSWRQPPTCPATAGTQPGEMIPGETTFALYGFKPVAAVRSGDYIQITVDGADSGLYGFEIPITQPPLTQPPSDGRLNFLFVEPSGQPIASCGPQGPCVRVD